MANLTAAQIRRNAKRAAKRAEIEHYRNVDNLSMVATLSYVDPLHNWPKKPQYKAIPDGNFMSSSATINERDSELGRWLHLRTYNVQRANTIIHNILHSEGIRSNPVMDENASNEARFSHTRSNSFHLMQVKAALINGHATPRDYGVEF